MEGLKAFHLILSIKFRQMAVYDRPIAGIILVSSQRSEFSEKMQKLILLGHEEDEREKMKIKYNAKKLTFR